MTRVERVKQYIDAYYSKKREMPSVYKISNGLDIKVSDVSNSLGQLVAKGYYERSPSGQLIRANSDKKLLAIINKAFAKVKYAV